MTFKRLKNPRNRTTVLGLFKITLYRRSKKNLDTFVPEKRKAIAKPKELIRIIKSNVEFFRDYRHLAFIRSFFHKS